MESPSYVLGALDALVKAGEVSPDYARGVRSVLEKSAASGITPDSPHVNYQEEMDAFLDRNKGRLGADGRLRISPDEAVRLIDRSRHWYDNALGRSKTYLGNRARKAFRWWPTANMTGAMYDRELADSRNRERAAYIKREFSRPGYRIDPEVAAAIQDAHVRDAGFRLEDAKRTMSKSKRIAEGITDDYADQYRTLFGTAPSKGGLYEPKFDKPKVQPRPRYGDNVPDIFGPKRDLFYRRPVN